MKTNSDTSFIKHFFIMGIGSFIYLIIGVIGTPVITRLVDPVEYGQLSIFNVYSSLGLMLCGLGLDQSLLRHFYSEDSTDYRRKLLWECCSIPLLIGGILGVVFSLLKLLLRCFGIIFGSWAELLLLEMNVLALILHRYVILVLRLNYHTKAYSLINIIQKTSYIVLSVCLITLLNGHHFLVLAFSTVCSSLIAVSVGIFLEHTTWNFKGVDQIPEIPRKMLLTYGFPLMLSSGITMVFNALDKLFLKHFCSMSDVGIYASAMNLMAVFSIVRTSFNGLWMPSAVKHYETDSGDTSFYQRGNSFITVFMVSFGVAVILFKDFFVLLLGEKYREASMIIPFLMFEPIMYTISETTVTGLVIQKQSKYQIIIASGACICNFIGNWILTPLMGPRGAALSTGLSYVVFFTLRTCLSNKVFYVDYGLKKFSIILVSLFLFSFYASSNSFSVTLVIYGFSILALLVLLYRGFLLESLRILKKSLKNRTK